AAAGAKPGPVSVVAFGDDEDSLRELERQVRPGVRLSWTTSALEVADLAVDEKATLVVLDIASRDGGAWRSAQALQERSALSQTAILLLPSIPAIAEDESDVGGLNLGWLSLIPKPFTAAQLKNAVSTAARASLTPSAGS
ncbi:MAG: hypothetical protein WD766_09215, partial [Gemmatimonadota bacterium]